ASARVPLGFEGHAGGRVDRVGVFDQIPPTRLAGPAVQELPHRRVGGRPCVDELVVALNHDAFAGLAVAVHRDLVVRTVAAGVVVHAPRLALAHRLVAGHDGPVR